MTSCDEYQAGIVALLDNEAGDEEVRLAAGHLQACPACRAFCLDLIGIRRTLVAAPAPSISLAAGEAVLDGIRPRQSRRAMDAWVKNLPYRWAAVLLIGLLSIACFSLGRSAKDLRTRLGAAERQVASVREQARLAESEERQRKAISALYFRMAELEDRVNRFSPSRRASSPVRMYRRPEAQADL